MIVVIKWTNESESLCPGYRPVFAYEIQDACSVRVAGLYRGIHVLAPRRNMGIHQVLEVRIQRFGHAHEVARRLQGFLDVNYGLVARVAIKERSLCVPTDIDLMGSTLERRMLRYRRVIFNALRTLQADPPPWKRPEVEQVVRRLTCALEDEK